MFSPGGTVGATVVVVLFVVVFVPQAARSESNALSVTMSLRADFFCMA